MARALLFKKDDQWYYENGCVNRKVTHEEGVEKVEAFTDHSQRHLDYFKKHNRVLGLDDPYGAYKEPEKTYDIGDCFEYDDNIFQLSRVYPTGSDGRQVPIAMVIIKGENKGCAWTSTHHAKDMHKITKQEFDLVCGSKAGRFTPIEVEIKEVEVTKTIIDQSH